MQKINSLIGVSSGFKGVIFINLSILVLVLALMFIQSSWISKEKKVLKSMIEKQSISKKAIGIHSPPEKLTKTSIEKKKQVGISDNFSQDRKVTKYNINNIIKEADMYFDYDQYEKAVVVYEKLINSNIAFDDSDRVFNRLAECYYKLGYYEKALEAYKRVCNNYLNSPYRLSAQLGLGECLILTDNYDEARRVLYSVTSQEAKHKEDEDKRKVIEAYYKIADSYIEQAKDYLKKEGKKQETEYSMQNTHYRVR